MPVRQKRSRFPRYRRSPHLVCYWHGGQLVLENFAKRRRVTADPLVCTLLDFFDYWRTAGDLVSRMPEYDPASVRRVVQQLARHGLLELYDPRGPARTRLLRPWRDWNPAAGFFHFSTKDLEYTTSPQFELRFLRQRARQWALPPSVKRYPGKRALSLPEPDQRGELPRVLLERRTWRRLSGRTIGKKDLGTLLGLTARVQRWVRTPAAGRLALKTSPSGGARHPVEVYVVVQRVRGVAPGIYHYSADRHRLERLRRGATRRLLASFLPEQRWWHGAAALLLFTAVFAREQWKYASPRAYRAVLLDAGHLCQNVCLVATWLGLAPFCTMALADSKIERALGVDGVSESVLYAAGVAARPRDGRTE